ncbi:hypothetical protein BH23ACT9_BH23ACT9_13800 [soil metagenome]
MASTISLEDLQTPKGRKAAAKKARKEARKTWDTVRATVEDRTETLLDAAGDQFDTARDAATPQVKRMHKKAVKAIDPVADKVRSEFADVSSVAARQVARLATDVRDATRGEADRIIEAIHDSAEEARAEERRGRVRALIGWTLFGMVAGAVLARQMQSTPQDDAIEVRSHGDQVRQDDRASAAEGEAPASVPR